MSATKQISVRRNTATLTTNIVEQSVLNMLREEVPEGATLYSFDPTVPTNEPLVFATDGTGTREWTQHIEHPFALQNWSARKVAIAGTDGESDVMALRVTLHSPDGEMLSFVSSGVARSLDLIRTLRGDGPYDPAIDLVVEPVKTRAGFQTFRLRPVYSKATPAVKK